MLKLTTSFENEELFRKKIIEISCGSFAIITLIGAFIRHWVSPMSERTLIGIFVCDSLFFIAYWISLLNKNYRLSSLLLFVGVFLISMNAGVNNGGLAAPVTVVFLILPLVGSLANGLRGSVIGFLFSLVGIVSLLILEKLNLVVPLQQVSKYNLYRGVILTFVTLITFGVAYFYEKLRRNNESNIISQRDFLNNILNVAPIGFLLLDDKLQILTTNKYLNDNYLKKGVFVKDIVGQKIENIFPQEMTDELLSLVKKLFVSQTQSESKVEVQFLNDNGSRIWLLIHGIKYLTEGKGNRSLITVTDITEQKFNSFLKDFHNSIMSNIAERMPIENTLNQIEMTVMDYFSDCHCKVDYHFDEAHELIKKFYVNLDFKEGSKNISFKFRTKEIVEQLVAHACQQSNLEKEHDNQKLTLINTSKMASIGEIVSIVAHEINNPITIILGRSELLRKSVLEMTENSRFIDNFNTMEVAAKRISNIVNKLKMFSENAFSEMKSQVYLVDLISQTLEFYSEKIRVCGINVKIELGDIAKRQIVIQGSTLNQAFMNLIRNAIDAVEKHEERWIKIVGEIDEIVNSKIILKIIDSGEKIAPEVQEKLMQQFFSTKRKSHRVGLGLSTARGIIKKHGGMLSFDKSNDRTCFIIELPSIDEPKNSDNSQSA